MCAVWVHLIPIGATAKTSQSCSVDRPRPTDDRWERSDNLIKYLVESYTGPDYTKTKSEYQIEKVL